MVPQFTTPTFTLEFDEESLDLREARNVYVTFTSGLYELTKQGQDLVIGEKTIDVFLNQEETGNFKCAEVEIQANWTSFDGKRVGSEVVKYPISKQLLKRVVE